MPHRATSLDNSRVTFEMVPFRNGMPPGGSSLFETEHNFYLSYDWLCNVTDHGIGTNSEARFGVLGDGASILALIPLQRTDGSGFSSLSNCYTCVVRPLISPSPPPDKTAHWLGRSLGRYCAAQPLLQLDCVRLEWPLVDAFE